MIDAGRTYDTPNVSIGLIRQDKDRELPFVISERESPDVRLWTWQADRSPGRLEKPLEVDKLQIPDAPPSLH